MIKISGFKNQTKLRKSTEALAKYLGIDCDVTVRKLTHEATEAYGFAAEILGMPTVCIMADCPEEIQSKVIAHEMIHIHQMVRGDLVFDYNNMLFHWKGKTFDKTQLDEMEYNDRPWEAEAKQLEKELAENFFMS